MNTTINHSELHKFIIGEIRVDGWKSQWKKSLEDYLDNKASSQLSTKKEER